MDTTGVYTTLEELIALQHRATGFTFLPRQPVHSLLTGRHASRMRGRGLDFEEIRHYLPGDDIRQIDWKVTARTKRPHSRVFTEERDRPALVLVDQRLSMFFGTRSRMKSVTAAEAAALAAWRIVGQGDRAGALVFDDADVVEIRPHRSRKHVMRILHAILEKNRALSASSEVSPAPGMLDEVLARARRLARHDHLIVILSDFDGAGEETRDHVAALAHHNDVIAAPIYDPLSTALPSGGRFVVSDGALQVEIDLGKERARRELGDLTDRRLAAVLAWQRELAVGVLPLTTDDGPAEQVRARLGAGTRARRG